MNDIRCFIAIELPEDAKAALSRTQQHLKNVAGAPARWVAPGSIHLTLVFLGEISPVQVEAVKGVMTSAASRTQPFKLALDSAGAFPDLKRPQIVWIALQGDLDVLSCLHKELEHGLKTMGYKPENRPFKPHLTLARIRDEASTEARRAMGDAIRLLPAAAPVEISVSQISLMKSTLLPAGPVYTRLYSAKLG